MAFQEIKLDIRDLTKRAVATLGYIYNPDAVGPNVFDRHGKPICIFRKAQFWPEGDVCLYVETKSGVKHLDVKIALSENEIDLLTGAPCDKDELH
jgi:hypothetical protein